MALKCSVFMNLAESLHRQDEGQASGQGGGPLYTS